MAVVRGALPDADGLSGVVPGSILPGAFGVEAGQSAVGDVFAWCARELGGGRSHGELNAAAARLRPGESGLVALDWHRGNRCVLADPALSGLVVGLGLHTTAAELYRASIEATAFGARAIIDRMVAAGVPIGRVTACGGIAQKSPLLMQIYADVLDRPMGLAPSSETCALGAAICGAVAAGAFASIEDAQARWCRPPARTFAPAPAAAAVYRELYELYGWLHDGFGGLRTRDLGAVMKRLLALRDEARHRS
jgi:L-ribulokinase